MKTYKFNICKYTVTVTIEKKQYSAAVNQEKTEMRDVEYTPADKWTSTVNEPDCAPSFDHAEETKMEEKDHEEHSYPFAWCCEQWIENQKGILADSTLKSYKNIVDNHLAVLMDCDYESITEELIQEAFDNERMKNLSRKTLKGYKSFVLKILAVYRPDLILEINVDPEEK